MVGGWYWGTLLEMSWLGECAWVCGIVGTFCGSVLGVDVKKEGILNGAWARGGGTGASRRGAWAVPRRTFSLYNRSVDPILTLTNKGVGEGSKMNG